LAKRAASMVAIGIAAAMIEDDAISATIGGMTYPNMCPKINLRRRIVT
jgi:hypothetical protein